MSIIAGWRIKEDRYRDAFFVNAKRGAEKKVWKEKPNIIIIWAQSNASLDDTDAAL